MDQPFEIKFEFPLAHSDLTVSLRATAELHHSEPYYVIDHFRFAGKRNRKSLPSLLPRIEIKKIERGSQRVWVHKDSERESQLSIALGRAIDKNISPEVRWASCRLLVAYCLLSLAYCLLALPSILSNHIFDKKIIRFIGFNFQPFTTHIQSQNLS